MKNFIGRIYDDRTLTNDQVEKAEKTIKRMMRLDHVKILAPEGNTDYYSVYTDDTYIVDFLVDEFHNDRVSLVKYLVLDDDGNPDPDGPIISYPSIDCKE